MVNIFPYMPMLKSSVFSALRQIRRDKFLSNAGRGNLWLNYQKTWD